MESIESREAAAVPGPTTGRRRIECALAREASDRMPMGTIAGIYPQALPALERHLGVRGSRGARRGA
jgi:hypothetical protein